jgi:hypothetical protein
VLLESEQLRGSKPDRGVEVEQPPFLLSKRQRVMTTNCPGNRWAAASFLKSR